MDFDTVFNRLIGAEGKYSCDPKDPGNWTGHVVDVGELKGTNWGVSAASYPSIDVKNLTRGAAAELYKRDFWDRILADKLPDAVAFQVFDFAVNSGIETAVRYLQRALGVADDGHFGKVSQEAVTIISESDLIMRLNAERLVFMTKLSNWPTASRGWARRIAQNLRYGAEDTEETSL